MLALTQAFHICKCKKKCCKIFFQTTKGVSGFTYSNVTGYATVTTDASHLMVAGNKVVLKDLLLNCNSPTAGNKIYPDPFYCEHGSGVNDVVGRATILTELIVDTIQTD